MSSLPSTLYIVLCVGYSTEILHTHTHAIADDDKTT